MPPRERIPEGARGVAKHETTFRAPAAQRRGSDQRPSPCLRSRERSLVYRGVSGRETPVRLPGEGIRSVKPLGLPAGVAGNMPADADRGLDLAPALGDAHRRTVDEDLARGSGHHAMGMSRPPQPQGGEPRRQGQRNRKKGSHGVLRSGAVSVMDALPAGRGSPVPVHPPVRSPFHRGSVSVAVPPAGFPSGKGAPAGTRTSGWVTVISLSNSEESSRRK